MKRPVTVVTGFLGSGKTTLLAKLLSGPLMKNTAVLVNEFGEVGLDHHLLRRTEEKTILLGGGVRVLPESARTSPPRCWNCWTSKTGAPHRRWSGW